LDPPWDDFTDRLPRIAETIRNLPVENAVIDGEAVALRPDGRSDFEALRTKAGAEAAAYFAFDLLQLNGKDIRQHLIEDRRAELERIVKGAEAILFSEPIAAAGALVFAKACEMGLEGIVSKRPEAAISASRAGRGLSRRIPLLHVSPETPTKRRADVGPPLHDDEAGSLQMVHWRRSQSCSFGVRSLALVRLRLGDAEVGENGGFLA